MRDPYEVLGVSKSASAAEIKSAFRRQAKKLHPDANKHDPKAAARFSELNAAYEILGEENKRKAFDRGEIDAEGKPRFQGFEGFGAAPGAGRDGSFESFTYGPGGFHRSGGGGRGFGARARTCGSNCRSRSTKRCSARKCACRRSTARSSLRSRPTPAPAASFASRVRAFRPRRAPATSSSACASCCPTAATRNSM